MNLCNEMRATYSSILEVSRSNSVNLCLVLYTNICEKRIN